MTREDVPCAPWRASPNDELIDMRFDVLCVRCDRHFGSHSSIGNRCPGPPGVIWSEDQFLPVGLNDDDIPI